MAAQSKMATPVPELYTAGVRRPARVIPVIPLTFMAKRQGKEKHTERRPSTPPEKNDDSEASYATNGAEGPSSNSTDAPLTPESVNSAIHRENTPSAAPQGDQETATTHVDTPAPATAGNEIPEDNSATSTPEDDSTVAIPVEMRAPDYEHLRQPRPVPAGMAFGAFAGTYDSTPEESYHNSPIHHGGYGHAMGFPPPGLPHPAPQGLVLPGFPPVIHTGHNPEHYVPAPPLPEQVVSNGEDMARANSHSSYGGTFHGPVQSGNVHAASPTFGGHHTPAAPHGPAYYEIQAALDLKNYLMSQLGNRQFADTWVEIYEGDADTPVCSLPFHQVFLARSPTMLQAIVDHSREPLKYKDGLKVLSIRLENSKFLPARTVAQSLQHLYGAPLMSAPMLTLGLLPFKADSEPEYAQKALSRMSDCLQYMSAGMFLQVPPIAMQGLEGAKLLVRWDTIEFALSFCLRNRVSPEWVELARRHLMTPGTPNPFDDRPAFHGDLAGDLLIRVLDFMAHGFPPTFTLDTGAPQLEDNPILPGVTGDQRGSGATNHLLRSIHFGQAQTGEPSFITSILSSILLSLPFDVLGVFFESAILADRLGTTGLSQLMDQIITERENRRALAMYQCRDAVLADPVKWEIIFFKERVVFKPEHPSQFVIRRAQDQGLFSHNAHEDPVQAQHNSMTQDGQLWSEQFDAPPSRPESNPYPMDVPDYMSHGGFQAPGTGMSQGFQSPAHGQTRGSFHGTPVNAFNAVDKTENYHGPGHHPVQVPSSEHRTPQQTADPLVGQLEATVREQLQESIRLLQEPVREPAPSSIPAKFEEFVPEQRQEHYRKTSNASSATSRQKYNKSPTGRKPHKAYAKAARKASRKSSDPGESPPSNAMHKKGKSSTLVLPGAPAWNSDDVAPVVKMPTRR
ncbi:hypothetical protein EJ06DRAFT_558118 [Trichodelitschia bisporula]|uniref:Uncharacterized protein n=1 Tax=Trichodelitschia bisporula TaxID=703511 RepID=A0A6G1HQJ1_9PEZI|nr:hypothetical protein EJ06DRAFT_558118 [Trichodelitschia bisporula]